MHKGPPSPAGLFAMRRAVAADAPAIRELTRRAYAKWVPVIGREPRPMSADYHRAVREHVIDLMEENGALVALIELIVASDYVMIENVAVDPGRQGAGLGALLLQHAERLAAGLGHRELRLYTNAAFATNIGFYAGRGYQEFNRAPLSDGGTVVHMRKFAAPSAAGL